MRRFLKALACGTGVLLVAAGAFAAGRQTVEPAATLGARPTSAEVIARVKQARREELRALKAYDAGKVRDAQVALRQALEVLEGVDTSGLPGHGDVSSALRAARRLDEAALKLMPYKKEAGNVRIKLNVAIVRKDAALDALGAHEVVSQPPADPPTITPVQPTAGTPPPPPEPPQVHDRFVELDEKLESLLRPACEPAHPLRPSGPAIGPCPDIGGAIGIKDALREDLLGPLVSYGFVTAADIAYFLEEIDLYLDDAAWDEYYGDYEAYRYDIGRAIAWKQALEAAVDTGFAEPPPLVRVSQLISWAHNTKLHLSNICIDLATTPAQHSVTVELFGPNGYHSLSAPYQPLVNGKLRLRSPITLAGRYTDTVTTYDAKRVVTGTATAEFTVDPPPVDGPKLDPACEAPA